VSQYARRVVDAPPAGPAGPAARAAGVLLPVSGGITVLGALLLFGVAVLGIGGSLLALLSLGCGALQVVLGTQQSAAPVRSQHPEAWRATVFCCLASSVVAMLLLPVGSGATLVAVLLPLVVVALLLAGDAPSITRTLRDSVPGRRSRGSGGPGGFRTRP
jgi:hypothetical protein